MSTNAAYSRPNTTSGLPEMISGAAKTTSAPRIAALASPERTAMITHATLAIRFAFLAVSNIFVRDCDGCCALPVTLEDSRWTIGAARKRTGTQGRGIAHSAMCAALVLSVIAPSQVVHAQPQGTTAVVSRGSTIYRVRPGTPLAPVQMPGRVVGMTTIPPGVEVANCQPGDVLAWESSVGVDRVWRIRGTSLLVAEVHELTTDSNANVSSLCFEGQNLWGVGDNGSFAQISTTTFDEIASTRRDLSPNVPVEIGGMAFDGVGAWYFSVNSADALAACAGLPTSQSFSMFEATTPRFTASGLEWSAGALWGALYTRDNRLVLGTFNVQNGAFSEQLEIDESSSDGSVAFTLVDSINYCDSIDFNNDTSLFDIQDVDALLSVFSEGPCIPAAANCNDVDFNNDGSLFDPCDIDSFLLVFSEGPCTLCGV